LEMKQHTSKYSRCQRRNNTTHQSKEEIKMQLYKIYGDNESRAQIYNV
jgi:hypothetical protein